MVNIVEQAKQTPRNATPVAWDAATLCYPGVNTCLTVSTIGKGSFGKDKKQGIHVGMHLGLFMGAGEEGGKGSGDSTMIDDAYLGTYLHVMEQHAWVRGGGAEKIYLAGALGVWRSSAATQWRKVTSTVDVWATKMRAPVEMVEFDDEACMTVDIYVTSGGVRFTQPGTQTVVPAL